MSVFKQKSKRKALRKPQGEQLLLTSADNNERAGPQNESFN